MSSEKLGSFTVTDDQNMLGLSEGDTVTFTPNIPGLSGVSEEQP